MIAFSVTMCFMGALFGVFALIEWFSILKPNVHTSVYDAIPIVTTTIAWLSSAVTFYQTQAQYSQIDIQRFFIVLGVVCLIWRIKVYRDASHKKDAIIKAQRETINQITVK